MIRSTPARGSSTVLGLNRLRAVATAAFLACLVAFALPDSGRAIAIPDSGTVDLAVDSELHLTSDSKRPGEAYTNVSKVGDWNGDGIEDFAVSSYLFSDLLSHDRNSVWVVFGRGDRFNSALEKRDVPLSSLAGAAFKIDGGKDISWDIGRAVAPAGDVNGDGRADILLGARGATFADRNWAGRAYVVYGRDGAGALDLDELQPSDGFAVFGANASDELGFAVSSIPDLDGDGTDEIALGAPGYGTSSSDDRGAVFVFYGRTGARNSVDLGATSEKYFRIDGPATGSRAGAAISSLGDQNGDSKAEIAVGAPGYASAADRQAGKTKYGAAFVVHGRDTTTPLSLGSNFGGYSIVSRPYATKGEPGGQLGFSLADAGDFNGDGRHDLVVGEPFADYGDRTRAGIAHILFGRNDGAQVPAWDLGTNGVSIGGISRTERAGYSVSGDEDFDGDGKSDVLISAYGSDPFDRSDAGAAYVIFGERTVSRSEIAQRARKLDPAGKPTGEITIDLGAPGSLALRIAGPIDGAKIGASVKFIGDFDRDGRSDIAIGGSAPSTTNKNTAGGTYVVYGPTPVAPQRPPKPTEIPVTLPVDPGEQQERQKGCIAAKSVQMVLDDSGSMDDTDPGRLTYVATALMLTKPRNFNRLLGASDFGNVVHSLFNPLEVGSEATEAALEAARKGLSADNGSTDYNAAFESLALHNPNADARIFMTDGVHNEGEYRDLHRGPIPVYVVRLGNALSKSDDDRLKRIAKETDGQYFAINSPANLPTVFNQIDALLNCDISHKIDSGRLKAGESGTVEEKVENGTESADVNLIVPSRDGNVEIDRVDVLRGNHIVRTLGRQGIRNAIRTDLAAKQKVKGSAAHRIRVQQWLAASVVGTKSEDGRFTGLRIRNLEANERLRVKVKRIRGKASRARSRHSKAKASIKKFRVEISTSRRQR